MLPYRSRVWSAFQPAIVLCFLLASAGAYFRVSRARNSPQSPYAKQTKRVLADTTVTAEYAERGQELFQNTCAACHGVDAQGLPHQGVNLRASHFLREQTDQDLVAFLRVGRLPNNPASLTGLNMPARGGNRGLDDDQLAEIVAYLRTIQRLDVMAGDAR